MLLAGQRSGRKDQKVKNETIYYFPERFITIESTEKTITLCVTLSVDKKLYHRLPSWLPLSFGVILPQNAWMVTPM